MKSIHPILYADAPAWLPARALPGLHCVMLILTVTAAFALRAAASAADAPITPKETIILFDGKDRKDLSPFYTWLPKFGHDDPECVFTVVDQIDGAPAIRISGKHLGGLITRAAFADYRLIAEFRWGTVTWSPRQAMARDSGILLHCTGEDGNHRKTFNAPWLRSIEYQIIEGGTGDIILLEGYDRGSDEVVEPKATIVVRAGSRVWDPAGTPAVFTRGRIDWQHRDPAWKNVIGFRGAKDVEKPVGEWNRIEVISEGGKLTYYLNGIKVNEVRDSNFKAGKLLFQSEGAEIFFRRIELQPLRR